MEVKEIIALLGDSESDSLVVGKELLEKDLLGEFISKEDVEANSNASYSKAMKLKDIVNLFVARYSLDFDDLEEIGYSKLELVKKISKKFPNEDVVNSFIAQAKMLSYTELQKEVNSYIKANFVEEAPVITAEELLIDQTKDRISAEFLIKRSKIMFYLSLYISTLSSVELQEMLSTIKREEEKFYEESEEEVNATVDEVEALPEL
ncbi:MAG: hypothetical protein EOM67_04710 [Spirochaetia bacterium]|nr:hypothetical protein [Spirochaetia bacterium]